MRAEITVPRLVITELIQPGCRVLSTQSQKVQPRHLKINQCLAQGYQAKENKTKEFKVCGVLYTGIESSNKAFTESFQSRFESLHLTIMDQM